MTNDTEKFSLILIKAIEEPFWGAIGDLLALQVPVKTTFADDIAEVKAMLENEPFENILVVDNKKNVLASAAFLEATAASGKKKIIIVGILPENFLGYIPAVGIPLSLGAALASYRHIEPGLYIEASAHLYKPDEYAKKFDTINSYGA